MKVLSGELEHDSGQIIITPGERMAVLKQDHFAYDEFSVKDTVMMGHPKLYQCHKDREAIYAKEDFTDEEYHFWMDVRNTHAEINGKAVKEYTKAQMLTWYNKLGTDSAEYKMWGNGIALPPALYCLQGMEEALNA